MDDDLGPEFDQWLSDRVREALRLAVVRDCRVDEVPGDGDGRLGRVCEYLLETEDALDDFVDGPGADIESDAAIAFGDDVTVQGRVLREDPLHYLPGGESPNCLNCGTRLRGQYCGNCGQRSRSRLISLWELISDAFGDLFEIDSRLWQTLVPLIARPGRLTHEYLQGRRARFMPPFRTYLVMSLIFFVVAFFDPRGDMVLVQEDTAIEDTPAAEGGLGTSESGPAALSEAERARQEIFDELAREGVIVGDGTRSGRGDYDGTIRFQFGDGTDVVELTPNEETGDCEVTASSLSDVPGWLRWLLTPARIKHICERIMVDDGRTFLNELLDNVPAALIVLLPLMAFVLKALYPLSRRYYVEHLLFFVHFHAFFFLILTLQILFARVGGLIRIPDSVVALTIVITSFYVPIYLFVALRKVYEQGRIVTLLKYFVLVAAYVAGFVVTMLGALTYAALSI